MDTLTCLFQREERSLNTSAQNWRLSMKIWHEWECCCTEYQHPVWPAASWLRPNHSNSAASLPLVRCCLNTTAITETLHTVSVLGNYVTGYWRRVPTLNLRVISSTTVRLVPILAGCFGTSRGVDPNLVAGGVAALHASSISSSPVYLGPKMRFLLFVLSFTCKKLLDETCLRVSEISTSYPLAFSS